MIRKRIVIIADDLTGANDTGVQFAKQGLDTLVILKMDKLENLARTDADVIVLDTGSRAFSAETAYQTARGAAKLIKKTGYDLIYKKVDSTLRGNLGFEIDAIMDECGFDLAVAAPAFPKTGRTTVNGVHLLNGVPLEDTEISRDPKCPVNESDVVKLLARQSKRAIGHVGIKEMKAGKDTVRKAIDELVKQKTGIIVADIWQDGQFKLLAEVFSSMQKNILWVGSAGLAEVLPELVGVRPKVNAKPAIVVVGSVSGVSRRQVGILEQDMQTDIIKVNTVKLLGEDAAGAMAESADAIKASIAANKNAVVVSGYNEEIVAAAKTAGAALGLDSAQVSDIVGESLGKIISLVMADKPLISGLVLTGGDTAVNVCNALSAYALKIETEVDTAIPLGFLEGGICQGLPVVTKAGAFGSDNALQKAVDALKERWGKKTF